MPKDLREDKPAILADDSGNMHIKVRACPACPACPARHPSILPLLPGARKVRGDSGGTLLWVVGEETRGQRGRGARGCRGVRGVGYSTNRES